MTGVDVKTSKGQVERLACFYYRKFHSIVGASLTVEDLRQEFWITWMSARDSYSPERGASFETFLAVCVRNRMISLVGGEIRRSSIWAKSLSEPVGEDGTMLVDMLPSNDEPVEQQIARAQERQRNLERIDPRLRLMIELLESTPPELDAEIAAANAKASYAESRGFAARPQRHLNLTLLSDIMGIGRCTRYRMIEEMQEIVNE
jgi:DNA-directed RNA polymerase specialized sigma24 family protein